jgi:hypothetical protein
MSSQGHSAVNRWIVLVSARLARVRQPDEGARAVSPPPVQAQAVFAARAEFGAALDSGSSRAPEQIIGHHPPPWLSDI